MILIYNFIDTIVAKKAKGQFYSNHKKDQSASLLSCILHTISYFRAVYIFYIYFDMYMYVRYDKQLTAGDLQLLEISPK